MNKQIKGLDSFHKKDFFRNNNVDLNYEQVSRKSIPTHAKIPSYHKLCTSHFKTFLHTLCLRTTYDK